VVSKSATSVLSREDGGELEERTARHRGGQGSTRAGRSGGRGGKPQEEADVIAATSGSKSAKGSALGSHRLVVDTRSNCSPKW